MMSYKMFNTFLLRVYISTDCIGEGAIVARLQTSCWGGPSNTRVEFLES